jgi:hypothetical protein
MVGDAYPTRLFYMSKPNKHIELNGKFLKDEKVYPTIGCVSSG